MAIEQGQRVIDPERARELLAKGEAAAIDLREQEAVAEGHAPGAAAVLHGNAREAAEKARSGRDLPILVFCEDGGRSEAVAEELSAEGIEAAAVSGGWESWVATDQPVQPRREQEFEGPDLSKPPGT